MDYQKLLMYYLSSDEWEDEMDYFFDSWLHYWDPEQEYYTPNHEPRYIKSQVYIDFDKKLAAAGGCYQLDLQLTDQQFQKYFDKRYDATQRFAILFGIWWGLNDAQIRRIADLRQKKNCLDWLNYFLCVPDAPLDIPVEEVKHYRYSGKYYAEVFEQPTEYTPPAQCVLLPLEDAPLLTVEPF